MQNWKKHKETLAYNGWRTILVKQFELPDGKLADFDVIGNNPYVTIAAFTPSNEAILVRQFRPGPEIELISFPEGYIDEGETPEDAARRELLEETGFEAESIVFLKEKRSAYSTEHQYHLLATGCKKVASQQLDQSEFIEVLTMPLEDFKTYLRDSKTYNFTTLDAAFMALDRLKLL